MHRPRSLRRGLAPFLGLAWLAVAVGILSGVAGAQTSGEDAHGIFRDSGKPIAGVKVEVDRSP